MKSVWDMLTTGTYTLRANELALGPTSTGYIEWDSTTGLPQWNPGNGGSASFITNLWVRNSSTSSLATATSNDKVLVGSSASIADIDDAQLIVSRADSGYTSTGGAIGIFGETASNGGCTGILGVASSAGAGSAVGVRGSATVTGISGPMAIGVFGASAGIRNIFGGEPNIGVYGSASGCSQGNYSFYGATGSLYNNGTGYFTGVLTSSVAQGTSPFSITSDTLNTNLNADLLDGNHSSAFQLNDAGLSSLAGLTWSSGSPLVKMTAADTFGLDSTAYITLASISCTATGLTYTNTTGAFSLTSGYIIPTTGDISNGNTAYGWGNHAGLYAPVAHKTTEDALNGLVKVDGAGNYSAVTDNHSNWDTAYTDRMKWDGGSTGLTAGTGRTSLALSSADSPDFAGLGIGVNGVGGTAGIITLKDGANPGTTATLSYAKWADLEAVNGLVACNGSGNYSAVTDSSTNWNSAYTDTNNATSAATPSTLAERDGSGYAYFARVGAAADNYIAEDASHNMTFTDAVSGTKTLAELVNAAAGASKALDNLASVAINTALLPGADNTIDLGSVGGTDYRFRHLYLSGNISDETNTLTVANAKAAYDHSQDNTQAHSDYLLNNASDATSGTLTMAGLNITGDSLVLNSDAAGSAADWTYTLARPAAGMTGNVALTLPVDDGTLDQYLKTDGAGALSWGTIAAGGDVTSAANIDDHTIVRGDGGAKGVQDTGITIDDSNNIRMPVDAEIELGDAAVTVSSQDDGHLDLTADTSIDLNGLVQTYNAIYLTQTDGAEKIDSDADGDVDIYAGTSIDLLIGGTEQVVLTDGKFAPTTDNDIDLGDGTHEFKDLYIDGTANIDSLVVDTADINGGTIDGATIGANSASTGVFTSINIGGGGVTSNISSGTYTPTFTPGVNCAVASVIYDFTWLRVGNVVTCMFLAQLTATAAAPTATALVFTLPVSCNSTPTILSGGAVSQNYSETGVMFPISATTGAFYYQATTAGATSFGGSFYYLVN
jgi:hypothetical protein